MKKLLALLLAVVMVTAFFVPTASAAADKDTAILATSDEPYRFFAQSKQSCSGADNLVLSNVYDCLLRLEPDGSLTPALAESYDLSEDGKTYTFHLRQGVKFHDGSEMTAEDVKFTLPLLLRHSFMVSLPAWVAYPARHTLTKSATTNM